MYGVSGSWFRDLGFLQFRGFAYGVLGTGLLIRGFDTGFRVRGFQVWGFGYGVVEVPVRLFLFFVRGFQGSGFRVGVFAVRGCR